MSIYDGIYLSQVQEYGNINDQQRLMAQLGNYNSNQQRPQQDPEESHTGLILLLGDE